MPRKPNSESERPILSLRVKPETLARLDELADQAGRSRSDLAGELLVAALNDEGVEVEHFSAEERATKRAAAAVRARLMRAVADELKQMEEEG